MFQIANPDFEFFNFSAEELFEVALSIADLDLGDAIDERVSEAVTECVNMPDLEKVFEHYFPQFPQDVLKSLRWAKELARLAMEHPKAPFDVDNERGHRPIVQMINYAVWAKRVSFQGTLERSRVDENTGQLVNR